ncbi:MAG: hypothetical protein ACYC7E_07155 [Armatimonadota bacterium]
MHMRYLVLHMIAWLVLLGIPPTCWAVSPPLNLVPNGSFESGTTSWTIAVDDPQGAGNSAVTDDLLPLGGNTKLKMSLYDEGSVSATSSAMTVTAGGDYQLTFWYTAAGFPSGVSAGYTLTWYNGGGGSLGTVSAEITQDPQATWTKVTRRVNAPANAASAKVTLTATATVTGILDSFFSLDNVKFTSSASLLCNGGFEGALNYWTPSVTGTGNTITADTASPAADTTALKIDMPNPGTATVTSTAMSVTAGRDYLLTHQFKSAGFGAGVSAAYAVTWYTGGGGTISTVTTNYPSSAVAEWTTYGPLRLSAPGTAATAKVIFTMTTSTGSAASTAWIDQVDCCPDPYLVLNSSFEGGLTSWTPSTSGSGTVAADTNQQQDGSQSLKLDVTSSIGSATATSTAVTVTGGRDFLLSFWYRSQGTNSSAVLGADVKWYDSGGGEITPAAHVTLPNAAQGTWTNKTQRVSPPAGAATLKVVHSLSTTTTGAYTLWIDQQTLDGDVNLLPNGGYEGGLTGFGTSTSGTGSSVSIDTTQSYEDLASVKLSVPNPSSSATLSMTNFVPVSANKEYEIGVTFRSEGFSDNGGYDNVASSYTIYFYNASQQQIGTQAVGFPYTAQSTWRLWSRVVLTPANTAYLKINCSISAYTDTLPSSIWLDKFEVIPYDTRLKVGGGYWLFRVADLGKYNKTYFRRGADDNTITGAAVIANPNFGTTQSYIAYAFYSTAVTVGQHRAVFRMKVGDVSVTRNVASLDVNTANDGLINVTPYTTDYFGQANTYRNLYLRFRKLDTAWVDFRAYWQAAVRTAVDTVTIYEEEVDN